MSLGGNNIGDDGAVALARGLADNDTLTELLVFSNSISLKHGPSFSRHSFNLQRFVRLFHVGPIPLIESDRIGVCNGVCPLFTLHRIGHVAPCDMGPECLPTSA